MRPLKVGADIDARCGRCRLELAHVVVAMAQGRPVRVQCKTCGNVHAYRNSAPSTRRQSARGSTATPKRVSTSASQYEELMRGRDVSRAQRYRASARYETGDVIDHARFGLGAVTRVLGDDKIEVLFAEGAKVLVHGRT